MRKRIIAGNWKLNGNANLCQQFLAGLKSDNHDQDVIVFPPAVYLSEFSAAIKERSLAFSAGAQNVAEDVSGAFTGEVSAQMLEEAGASFCLVGHSERRALFGETDKVVAAKLAQVLSSSMRPVFCVGEGLQVREAGEALPYVRKQVSDTLRSISSSDLSGLIVAYEPVWAIGTGKTATTSEVQEVHQAIRAVMAEFCDAGSVEILYGGSVNAGNAADLLQLPDVDGVLVGGASLDLEQFNAIVSC